MGIKGLNQYINDHYPHLVKRVPLSLYRGKIVAFDAMHYMYKFLNVANSRQMRNTNIVIEDVDHSETMKIFYKLCLDNLTTWLNYGITVVFVFDGESPIDKQLTLDKRQDQRDKVNDEIEQLQGKLQHLSFSAEADPDDVKRLKSLKSRIGVSTEDRKSFASFLRSIGIPVINAKHDGEKQCSNLTIDGYCDAVYSSDSDCSVFGAKEIIKDLDKEEPLPDGTFSHIAIVISLPEILASFEMTYRTYMDLCIMSGCDYNTNIKMIGIGKSYKLLKQCESIDNLNGYDITCLNHKTCRQIFQPNSSEDECIDVNDIKSGLKYKRVDNIEQIIEHHMPGYGQIYADRFNRLFSEVVQIDRTNIKRSDPDSYYITL